MKFFNAVIFLFSISMHGIIAQKFVGKWYEWYVKELKDILKNGLPCLGIPELDPYQVNSSFNWQNPTNKINLNLRGLLSNFSDFYVNNIDIKPDLQSLIELQFTSISFIGTYHLKGEAMKMIPLDSSDRIESLLLDYLKNIG
ncbi:uncharacterized protein isoform X2 [Rhodnius prolixus]|uniref:uncharacterized protein isoform X2 n=1 Tax=Rhodnius prolixus TaxID=13249 RepID=UPI003D1899AE